MIDKDLISTLNNTIKDNEDVVFYYIGNFYKVSNGEILLFNNEFDLITPYRDYDELNKDEIRDIIHAINMYKRLTIDEQNKLFKINTIDLEKSELLKELQENEGEFFECNGMVAKIHKEKIFWIFNININNTAKDLFSELFTYNNNLYIDEYSEFDTEKDIRLYIDAIRYNKLNIDIRVSFKN